MQVDDATFGGKPTAEATAPTISNVNPEEFEKPAEEYFVVSVALSDGGGSLTGDESEDKVAKGENLQDLRGRLLQVGDAKPEEEDRRRSQTPPQQRR